MTKGVSIRNNAAIVVLTGALGVACTPELPAHEVDSVSPLWGYNGEVTAISVSGQDFFPSVAVDGTEENGGRVDAQYEVSLVGVDASVALTGVSLIDYTRIDALVPAGIMPGLYDLEVRSPRGAEVRLEQAFTVTNTRADSLLIELEGVVHAVNDSVAIEFSLRDPDGLLVEQDLEVQLEVMSDAQASGVVIEDWGLQDATELADRVGVRGNLGPDGRSVVVLTSTMPDELTLSLGPVDPNSIVRNDEAVLVFEAGDADQVEILLPTEGFTATAGEGFDAVIRIVDEFGNLVADQSSRVSLFEECGGFLKEVTVVGSLSTRIEVTKATGMHCPQNRVVAMSTLEGASESFSVLPGALNHFEGERGDGNRQFTAGVVGPFHVTGRDAFENAINLNGVPLEFEDSASSLGFAECDLVSTDDYRLCNLVFEEALEATDVTIRALGTESVVGVYEVVPNVASQMLIGPLANSIVAGTLFELQIEVTDAWGNAVEINETQTPFEVSDGGFGAVSCNSLGSQSVGAYVLSCAETFAAEHVQFTVNNLGLGILGLSDIVTVYNGPLDHVDLTASALQLEAGEAFDLEIEAYDQFRNPYLQQASSALQMSDTAGGLSSSQAQLGSTGTVSVSGLRLEKVGEPVELLVRQGGLTLGSLAFTVGHGPVDHFGVELQRSWAWVGEETSVQLEARDAYENPVLTFNETVQVSSQLGGFISRSISGFQGGSVESPFTWDTVSIGDQVAAVAPSASGISEVLDAVSAECGSPPVPDMSFIASGGDELVACENNGAVSTGVDFSGSVSGAQSIVYYHLYNGTDESSRSVSDTATLQVEGVGVHVPELVVVDSLGCGAITDGLLWVGGNDGSVSGRVTISTSSDTVTAGSATQGQSTISVSAQDCAGDVAAGALLYARVDLGELDPSSAVLANTGEGQALFLDGQGNGSFVFSAQATRTSEVADVAVGGINGASFSEVAIDVEGDNEQPRVIWVDPRGTTTELVDRIDVGFSEPIEESTLGTNTVSVEDSAGNVSTFLAEFSDPADVLTIQLDDEIDSSLDAFVLTIGPDLRDQAGNFLDGDWSGSAAGTVHESHFGAVADDGISVTSCSVASDSFRPDGDPGVNASQADTAQVSVVSSSRAAFWWLDVWHSDERIQSVRQATNSVSEVLEWDGRGLDGQIVQPGAYEVVVSAMDPQDNIDAGCSVPVTVEQAYAEPERVE